MLDREPGLLHVLARVRRDRLELLIKSLVEIWFFLDSRQPLARRRRDRLGHRLAGEFRQALGEGMSLRVLDVEGHVYLDMSLFLPLPRPRRTRKTARPASPTVNVNEFRASPSARNDKIRPNLFRARQADDPNSVPIQSGGHLMLSRFFRFVTAAAIFGFAWITFVEASEQGLPSATHTPVGGETAIPYGWVDFCTRHSEECTLGKLRPMDVHLTKATWKILNEINLKANNAIEPISNFDHWGTTLDH